MSHESHTAVAASRSRGPRLSIIPGRFAAETRAGLVHFRVLNLIGRHTDDEGWCIRSQIRMARELDLARETVNRALADLVAWGYVQKIAQATTHRSVCFYRVLLDTPFQPVAPVDNLCTTGDEGEGGCDPELTGGVTQEVTGGVTAAVTQNDPCLTTPVQKRGRARDADAGSAAQGARKFAEVFAAKKFTIRADAHPQQWAAWHAWATRHERDDRDARFVLKMMGLCRTLVLDRPWPPGTGPSTTHGLGEGAAA